MEICDSLVGVSLLFAILHYDILSPAPVLEKFFTFANALLLSLFMSCFIRLKTWEM